MVVPGLPWPALRCRGSWRPPAFSTEFFGKTELAAGGNCSGLDKLQLAWPEAALPRCAAGHGRSVLTAACLTVSLLGDRRPFRGNMSCMAHPARRDIPRRPSNQTFVAVPKLKRNTSRRPPSALAKAWNPWAEGGVVRREGDEIRLVAVLAQVVSLCTYCSFRDMGLELKRVAAVRPPQVSTTDVVPCDCDCVAWCLRGQRSDHLGRVSSADEGCGAQRCASTRLGERPLSLLVVKVKGRAGQ